MAIVEGIAVGGDYVSQLQDKRFAVAGKPHYEEIPQIDDPTVTKRKLVMTILMYHDRTMLEYYPNKSSIKTMSSLYGYEMDNWVGKVLEWEVIPSKFMGQTKNVLFVKNKKFDEVVPLES